MQHYVESWESLGFSAKSVEALQQLDEERERERKKWILAPGPLESESMNKAVEALSRKRFESLLDKQQHRKISQFFARHVASSRGVVGFFRLPEYSSFVGTMDELNLSLRRASSLDNKAKQRIAELSKTLEETAVKKFFSGEKLERLLNLCSIASVESK